MSSNIEVGDTSYLCVHADITPEVEFHIKIKRRISTPLSKICTVVAVGSKISTQTLKISRPCQMCSCLFTYYTNLFVRWLSARTRGKRYTVNAIKNPIPSSEPHDFTHQGGTKSRNENGAVNNDNNRRPRTTILAFTTGSWTSDNGAATHHITVDLVNYTAE